MLSSALRMPSKRALCREGRYSPAHSRETASDGVQVLYEDGDDEWLDLGKERFSLTAPPGRQQGCGRLRGALSRVYWAAASSLCCDLQINWSRVL